MTIEIIKLTDWDELHCWYHGQTSPQGCYIELDCRNNSLAACYNHEIGNAIPFSLYHGHDRRYGIPCITADAANDLMEELLPLAERVVAGYRSEWDGHNHVARLDADAIAAEEEIERMIAERDFENDGVSTWDASEWLDGSDLPITAATTDEEIAAMAYDIEEEASCERIILIATVKYLERRREDLAE